MTARRMSGLHLEQLQEVVEQQRAEIERLRLKVPDRDKLLAEIERLRAALHRVLATERRKVRENRAEWFDDICCALEPKP